LRASTSIAAGLGIVCFAGSCCGRWRFVFGFPSSFVPTSALEQKSRWPPVCDFLLACFISLIFRPQGSLLPFSSFPVDVSVLPNARCGPRNFRLLIFAGSMFFSSGSRPFPPLLCFCDLVECSPDSGAGSLLLRFPFQGSSFHLSVPALCLCQIDLTLKSVAASSSCFYCELPLFLFIC